MSEPLINKIKREQMGTYPDLQSAIDSAMRKFDQPAAQSPTSQQEDSEQEHPITDVDLEYKIIRGISTMIRNGMSDDQIVSYLDDMKQVIADEKSFRETGHIEREPKE